MTRKPEGSGRNRSFEIDTVHAKGGGGEFMEFYGLNNGFIYLVKDPRDPLLHIHLFESDAIDEVRTRQLIHSFSNLLRHNKTDLVQQTSKQNRDRTLKFMACCGCISDNTFINNSRRALC